MKIFVFFFSSCFTLKGFSGLDFENQMSRFEQFLFRSRNYPSLALAEESGGGDSKFAGKAILVEDLPFLLEEPEQVAKFRVILRK